MSALIIDGKALASRIKKDLKVEVHELKENRKIFPGLAVILVGDDPASKIYVRNKERACDEVGIKSKVIYMSEDSSQEELLKKIDDLNNNADVHGILVQLPLPKHIDEKTVIDAINPKKDVDGFHPITIGNMMIGNDGFRPCTPKGIIELIKETGQDIEGKNVVIIGRSNIVGKPLSIILLNENATVTICHSRTKNIKEHSIKADILIVAIGKPEFINDEYVKEDAIVIDVGTTRVDDKLKGDVDFDSVRKKASWITPVPGGVGPMTITMLLKNTIKAAKKYE